MLRFRSPRPADGRGLWQLARTVGLDENSPYAYVMWADHFASTSIVAEDEPADGTTRLAGFVTGFEVPARPGTLFVWQVGVNPDVRRQGVGGRMLDALVERSQVTAVEATVTPGNQASIALFRGLGARHRAPVAEEVAYPADLFPVAHEPEVRFRIGPIGTGSHPP